MKIVKRIFAVAMAVAVVASCFAGCSSKNAEIYSKDIAILGYTKEVAPFLTDVKDGKAKGFEADLWNSIFDSVKGDLKGYRFEQIDEGYTLEESGGFFDSTDREYSACLMFGAVSKNNGTFNKDYSYTEPIITNRVITVTAENSKITTYAQMGGARVAVVGDVAKKALEENRAIYSACASVTEASLEDALAGLGISYDAVVVDEFTYRPDEMLKSVYYPVVPGELDTIEYVIACAKNSGWKDSINEAIREMKSEKYGEGDEFTPLVLKYFGYNASSFSYETDGDQ
ncbi:substrate-binding periplasmic protein [Eubacterium sp.]|uniref:substrate-binding periplasmic protein n=1 Tax=Eubacterium sp. TaxID=142586 RepID=UPI003F124B02